MSSQYRKTAKRTLGNQPFHPPPPDKTGGTVRVVGTARCAVPVAERSVRRRNNGRFTTFVPSCRTGTPQRSVPTIQKVCQRHNPRYVRNVLAEDWEIVAVIELVHPVNGFSRLRLSVREKFWSARTCPRFQSGDRSPHSTAPSARHICRNQKQNLNSSPGYATISHPMGEGHVGAAYSVGEATDEPVFADGHHGSRGRSPHQMQDFAPTELWNFLRCVSTKIPALTGFEKLNPCLSVSIRG